MNDRHLEHAISDILHDEAEMSHAQGLADEITASTRAARPRPRWLASVGATPVRGDGSIAVGSPNLRAIAILASVLLLAVLAVSSAAIGLRILVSPVIVVAADGSGDHTTIGAALAVAEDGDTILVKEGTYEEAISISGDIALRGEGPTADRVIVRIPDDSIGIRLKDSDAEIELLTVLATAEEPVFAAVDVAGGAPVLRQLEIHSEPGHAFNALRLLATEAELHHSTLSGRVEIGAGADVLLRRNSLRRGDRGQARSLVPGDGIQGGFGRAASVEAIGVQTKVEMVGNTLESFVNQFGTAILRDNDIGGARAPGTFDQPGDVFGCAVTSSGYTELIDNTIHDSDTGVCGFVVLRGGTIEGNELGFAWSTRQNDYSPEHGLAPLKISGATITDNDMAFRVAPLSTLIVEDSAVCRNSEPDVIDASATVAVVAPRPCD